MNIIIQKFGGTSVATEELRERVAKKIISSKVEGKTPVVVVSAIGRSGDPYATDTLIGLANRAFKEQSSRELDMIMACGEVISAVIMANTIKALGCEAVALSGFQAGIFTDKYHGDAEVVQVDCEPILNILKEGKIPVVTGFQGATLTGDITTLGRGGSDTTAAILGEALKADVVEIYTDVDGVMTADPRLVPEAKVIDNICYDEIYQMAEDGAKVVHPRAVEIARRGSLTLKIKNTFSDAPGTVINGNIGFKGSSYRNANQSDLLTAIAHKNGITQFTVFFNEDSVEESERFMNELTDKHISIDLINFFTDRKVFTVDEKNVEKLEQILKLSDYKFKVTEGCSKITAIGHKIRGVPGVMARIVSALARKDVQILQSSDSHTTISILVKQSDMEEAVNALHREFNLSR
jgi:aspartate kinase